MKNLICGALTLLILVARAAVAGSGPRARDDRRLGRAHASELGGDRVDVYVATTAMQDVHRVEAKPSLVARARTADLLVVERRRARGRLAAGAAAGVRQRRASSAARPDSSRRRPP